MSRNVKIHIGMDKTGTTAIQKYCEANEQKILDNTGWLYYPIGREHGHHLEIAQQLGFSSENPINHGLAQPAETVDKRSCNNTFISSEHFSYRCNEKNTHQLYEYFSGFNKEILVYYRRPSAWFLSVYSECIKWGSLQSLDEFFEQTKWRLDYLKFHAYWINEFGSDNVHVKNYDMEKSDLLTGFLSEITEIDHKDHSTSVNPDDKVNPGINLFDIQVLQQTNMLMNNTHWKDCIRLYWHYCSLLKEHEALYSKEIAQSSRHVFNKEQLDYLERSNESFLNLIPSNQLIPHNFSSDSEPTPVQPISEHYTREIARVSKLLMESYAVENDRQRSAQ